MAREAYRLEPVVPESPPGAARSQAESNLKGAGILLPITALFYWKILLTRQFTILNNYEGVNQAYAWLNFQIRGIQHGVWPLWDPSTFSGHTFSGEMQTGAFYPLYLLLALVPFNRHGMFSPQLFQVMYAAVHFLGAYFMFLLVRELELSFFAAIMAGICFSLGGLMAQIPAWPHLLNSGIWLPPIVLFVLKALKARGVGHTALYASACGGCLGLSILAGGIHFAMMQAIVIVTAVGFHCFRTGTGLRAVPRAAMVIGIAGLVAFAAGAVQLLPSIEYSRRAVRFVGAPAFPASDRIPYYYLHDGVYAHSLLHLLIAPGVGRPTGPFEAVNPYFGVFPLLLSAIGIWKNWRQPWVRYMTGLAVAAFVYSLGPPSLLHGVLYAVVPWLSIAREASRFMYLADFALVILAAYGIDTLFSPGHGGWERLDSKLKWVAVACLVPLAARAVYAQIPLDPFVSLSLILVVASWSLFRYLAAGHRGTWARILTVAIILFDLSAFDWSAANRIDLASTKTIDRMDELLSCTGVAQFLKSRQGLFRSEFAMASAPNIGDAFEVQMTGGNGVTLLTDYAEFMGHPDLLNVRYSIKPATAADPGAVYQDAAWKVYENPRAYPRAWLVHETIVENSRPMLLQQLSDPGIDLHRTALVETPLAASLAPSRGAAGEQVRFERYEANRAELNVSAAGQALLILSELDYPGWTAIVNGRPAHIGKVDGMLRGIVVPGGDSKVSLRYRPASIYVGATVSAITLAGVLAALFALRLRRWRAL